MSDSKKKQKARHPIGVVSRRTGIPQDLLRAWERRYDAVIPHRSSTGRRLYTDQDIQRLGLMKRALEAGRRISDVAALSLDGLQSLAQEDAAALPSRGPVVTGRSLTGSDPGEFLEQSLEAVADLDVQRLETVLAEAMVNLSPPAVRQEVLVPLMQQIGERWRDGTFRVVHEHLASSVVRSVLSAAVSNRPAGAPGPTLVVTTPAGQLHEFGALLAAAVGSENGWEVVYLGPNLPAEEIAAATRLKGAKALALSIIYPSQDPRLHEELKNLRQYVGPRFPILVGGRSSRAMASLLREIGAILLDDLASLQQELEKLAS